MNVRTHALLMVFAMSLTACAGSVLPSGPGRPALSRDAIFALAVAEAEVETARSSHTLWVAAEEALSRARAAAESADNVTVIEEARRTSELCRLGAQQATTPPVRMP
ncbi:MAG: hypothetical protein ACOZB0_13060 [Pseudomonadota bacterium]